MPHLIIASDSWKGSLSASAACAAMQRGCERVFPDATFSIVPLADGGEGTVEALLKANGGQLRTVRVHDPLGRKIQAQWALLPDNRAVIEMASASGLTLVAPESREPLRASSVGTGELIRATLDAGCREILLGIGGSATTDGGVGALRALGARFLDARGKELAPGGEALQDLAAIETSDLDARLKKVRLRVLCDVSNPLCGENGAAFIYAAQKGASLAEVEILDAALNHFARIAARTIGHDFSDEPGAGAAGGMGFGLMNFASAQLQPGIELVLEAARFEEKLGAADLVLTGEGSLDAQTLSGKTIAGVASAARKKNVPVIAWGGAVKLSGAQMDELGIMSAMAVAAAPMSLGESLELADELLENAVERALRIWRA